MVPNVMQSLWIGTKLSTLEVICLKSFMEYGHEFHLYTYDPIENLPEGVVVKDGESILPRSVMFKDAYGSWGAFSDWFRYKMLYDKGGCWIDMDCICVSPIHITEDYGFSSEYNGGDNKQINCGFIKAPAGAAFLKECLSYIELRGLKNMKWGEIGPSFFSKVINKYELGKYVNAPEVFCPINYYEMHKLIGGYSYDPAPETLAIHCWNELWRRSFLDKDGIYHPDSIYETMKAKYI